MLGKWSVRDSWLKGLNFSIYKYTGGNSTVHGMLVKTVVGCYKGSTGGATDLFAAGRRSAGGFFLGVIFRLART